MEGQHNNFLKRNIRAPGNKHKNAVSSEFTTAVNLFGRSFVDSHLEALREGRTRRTLTDLIRAKQK